METDTKEFPLSMNDDGSNVAASLLDKEAADSEEENPKGSEEQREDSSGSCWSNTRSKMSRCWDCVTEFCSRWAPYWHVVQRAILPLLFVAYYATLLSRAKTITGIFALLLNALELVISAVCLVLVFSGELGGSPYQRLQSYNNFFNQHFGLRIAIFLKTVFSLLVSAITVAPTHQEAPLSYNIGWKGQIQLHGLFYTQLLWVLLSESAEIMSGDVSLSTFGTTSLNDYHDYPFLEKGTFQNRLVSKASPVGILVGMCSALLLLPHVQLEYELTRSSTQGVYPAMLGVNREFSFGKSPENNFTQSNRTLQLRNIKLTSHLQSLGEIRMSSNLSTADDVLLLDFMDPAETRKKNSSYGIVPLIFGKSAKTASIFASFPELGNYCPVFCPTFISKALLNLENRTFTQNYKKLSTVGLFSLQRTDSKSPCGYREANCRSILREPEQVFASFNYAPLFRYEDITGQSSAIEKAKLSGMMTLMQEHMYSSMRYTTLTYGKGVNKTLGGTFILNGATSSQLTLSSTAASNFGFFLVAICFFALLHSLSICYTAIKTKEGEERSKEEEHEEHGLGFVAFVFSPFEIRQLFERTFFLPVEFAMLVRKNDEDVTEVPTETMRARTLKGVIFALWMILGGFLTFYGLEGFFQYSDFAKFVHDSEVGYSTNLGYSRNFFATASVCNGIYGCRYITYFFMLLAIATLLAFLCAVMLPITVHLLSIASATVGKCCGNTAAWYSQTDPRGCLRRWGDWINASYATEGAR
eukprot:gb/GECG01006664.1/.p1 GENE.gb/GECG01006664.1/~~gb/GECG01006664.1/.p1  ORF type:complete len:755 (+),score=68.21 gb/GECG01006664.1/:1-2265(+)